MAAAAVLTGARRAGLALLIGLALAVAGWTPAVASCAFPVDDPGHRDRADVIFSGAIVRDETSRRTGERRVTFAVDRVYKGEAYAEQVVTTDTRTSVALQIAGPGRFVVFARYGAGRALESDACSGTRAGEPPAALGTGGPPVPGSSGAEFGPLDTMPLPVLVVAALSLVAAGALGLWTVQVVRRRSAARTEG